MKKKLNLHDVPRIESVQDMVVRSCEVYKDKLAMEDLQEYPINRVTYAELKENVLKFGKALQALDLKERTHIALIGENRVQWSISYLTLMSFNYVIVPIDKNLPESEILNIIHESDSEAVIFSDTYFNTFSENKSVLKSLNTYINMDRSSDPENFLSMKQLIDDQIISDATILPKVNPEDLAEIIFTSGSLGRAKGVMLSQKNLASNLVNMVSMLMMYPKDRFLSVLPIHHTYECTCGMLCPLYAGSSIHYSRSLKTVAEDMQKVKATIVLGVPLLFDKMYKKVMKAINEDKKKSFLVPKLIKLTNITQKLGVKDLKKKIFKELQQRFGGAIRIFIVGGAAADPIVAEGLQGFGFAFIQGYGLTETSPILTVNQIDNFKNDAAGVALPSVELKIVDPDENGVGEIYARGDSIMLGYYKNNEQTEATFDSDWFKTGDLGFIDNDNFLHIAGRKKNVIISKSGKNVFPEEVEDQLNHCPYIQECLVYGEKDAKQDEIIVAQLVVDTEAFLLLAQEKNIKINDDLIHDTIAIEVDRINKKLASYKRIVRFHIRENEFEKTTTQKIKRYLVN
jgi:long-chain acyl-CoA synthetase